MLNRTLAILLLAWWGGLYAQVPEQPEPSLNLLRTQYENLQFDKAIQTGRTLLQNNSLQEPGELVEVHRYMALSFFTLGELDSARAHFLSLLTLAPHFQLDPVTVSPKIIQFFEQLKSEWRPGQGSQAVPPGTVRYVVLPDSRLSAAWRSALLPGWGQLYKGQKKKGLLLGGLFASSAIASLVSWALEAQAHQDYLDATAPDVIEKNYQDYNRWYKRRRWLTGLTAAIWIGGVVDALVFPGHGRPALHVSPGGAQLHLQWHIP